MHVYGCANVFELHWLHTAPANANACAIRGNLSGFFSSVYFTVLLCFKWHCNVVNSQKCESHFRFGLSIIKCIFCLITWIGLRDLIMKAYRQIILFCLSFALVLNWVYIKKNEWMSLTFPHQQKRIFLVWDHVKRCLVRGRFLPLHTFAGINVLLPFHVNVFVLERMSGDHPAGGIQLYRDID